MPFDLQPTLRGSLLTLRPLDAADYDALFAVACDPLIWEQHPDRERHTEARFRVFFDGAIESSGAFIITDNETGFVIGSSRYLALDEARSEVEIGFSFLARSHWGGRYNAEMKRLMLDHAFRFVDRVVFHVGPENWRSRRAVEKIGGVFAGRYTHPVGREVVVYEILKAKWSSEKATKWSCPPDAFPVIST
jgi:RimJ/RimL family protein N-acetyltransferase